MKAASLLVALALAASAAEAADCNDGWLDIEERVAASGVTIAAVNRGEYPATFTLRARRGEYVAEGPREVTATLAPGGIRELMRLEARAVRRARRAWYCDWTVGSLNAQHDDSQLYLLPYARDASYRVLQGYGSRFSHTGREQFAVDFKMDEGTPVHAARDGVVARIEEAHDRGCWEDGCGRYANYIVVLHDDGTTGEYYHLKHRGALVEPGQRVRAGQRIGLSGNTGHSTMPHLHFAVYRAVDWGRTQSIPVRFLTADGIIGQPRRGARYLAASPGALDEVMRTDARRSD